MYGNYIRITLSTPNSSPNYQSYQNCPMRTNSDASLSETKLTTAGIAGNRSALKNLLNSSGRNGSQST